MPCLLLSVVTISGPHLSPHPPTLHLPSCWPETWWGTWAEALSALTLIHRPSGASFLSPGPIARRMWQKLLHSETTLDGRPKPLCFPLSRPDAGLLSNPPHNPSCQKAWPSPVSLGTQVGALYS